MNKDKPTSVRMRVLTLSYFLGINRYYTQAKELTYGQSRHLFLVSGMRLGFKHEALSTCYDYRDSPEASFPEDYGEMVDAMDAGSESAGLFFETGDWNQIATIRHKFREWFDPNYSGDLGF